MKIKSLEHSLIILFHLNSGFLLESNSLKYIKRPIFLGLCTSTACIDKLDILFSYILKLRVKFILTSKLFAFVTVMRQQSNNINKIRSRKFYIQLKIELRIKHSYDIFENVNRVGVLSLITILDLYFETL